MKHTFLLRPDYDTVIKYHHIPESKEDFEKFYSDGYQSYLAFAYRNENGEDKFMGEHITEVEGTFKEILKRYQIDSTHYDNLLFILINKRNDIDGTIMYNYDIYPYKKRAQEAAKLVLTFKKTELKDFRGLSFKTFKETVKVSDTKLLEWIGSVVESALLNPKQTAELFSLDLAIQMQSFDDLETLAKERIPNPESNYKGALADFCFSVYHYLINETFIRPDKTKPFSADLLKLYFDILVLFEMIDPDRISSDSEDYIRTVLMNQIKRLNPRLSGK